MRYEKSHFSVPLAVEKMNWHNARKSTKCALIQTHLRFVCVRPAGQKENSKSRNSNTMAIYHLSMKIISRSKGHSAVASAAYRAGEKIPDERTGLTHDYTRKSGVASAVILTPANAPAWCANRTALWNTVEKNERRKNSQLAREFELAIPRELAKDAARETVLNFVRENFICCGMIADVAFHNLGASNPHAHIMLTMRAITPDGFGEKVRDWNNRTHAETWRASWAEHANRALEKAGYLEAIDHRSYHRQGIDREPGIHLGKSTCALEKRGFETERGTQNHLINRLNLEIHVTRTQQAISDNKNYGLQLSDISRRVAEILNLTFPTELTAEKLQNFIRTLPDDCLSAWKLTDEGISLSEDLQKTSSIWHSLKSEREKVNKQAETLKKKSPLSVGLSRIPLMQWASPEYNKKQEKIQNLSARMKTLNEHYNTVKKQDIPASQATFQTLWIEWGSSGLTELKQLLTRQEEELRRQEEEAEKQRREREFAERLRQNDNRCLYESEIQYAEIVDRGIAPAPETGEMTSYMMLKNRSQHLTIWGNELERCLQEQGDLVRIERAPGGRVLITSTTGVAVSHEEAATADAYRPTKDDNALMEPGKSVTGRLLASGWGVHPGSGEMTDWIMLKTRTQTRTFWGRELGELVRGYQPGSIVTVTMNTSPSDRTQVRWTMHSGVNPVSRMSTDIQAGEEMQLFDAAIFRAAMAHICRALPQWHHELQHLPLPSEDIVLMNNGQPGKPDVSSHCKPSPRLSQHMPMVAGCYNSDGMLLAALYRTAGNFYQGVMHFGKRGLLPVLVTPVNQKLVVTAITEYGPRYAGYGNAINTDNTGAPVPPENLAFTLPGRISPLRIPLTKPHNIASDDFRLLGFQQTMQQWEQELRARQERLTPHRNYSLSPRR